MAFLPVPSQDERRCYITLRGLQFPKSMPHAAPQGQHIHSRYMASKVSYLSALIQKVGEHISP